MSAIGTKRICTFHSAMSAFGGKADKPSKLVNVSRGGQRNTIAKRARLLMATSPCKAEGDRAGA